MFLTFRLLIIIYYGIFADFYSFIFSDPPEITLRPRDQQVKAGGIAAFYCAARGDPPPSLQWRKNGKRVSNTQSRYLVQVRHTSYF